MSAVLPRVVAAIEALSAEPHGLLLGEVAERIYAPKSATHRVLLELLGLLEVGYVTQSDIGGRYTLGLRMVSQALRHLAAIPLVERAKPLLDRLASMSGELARLGVPDQGAVVWVAKAQGARNGLRYDPDDGGDAKLARTSTGLVWLSTLTTSGTIQHLERQGFDDLAQFRPRGPENLDQAIQTVNQARAKGYCYTDSTFELGTASIAAPVQEPGKPAPGLRTCR